MTLRAIALVALVALCSTAHAAPLPLSVEVLPNGLHVVLAPDPSVSSVVVHVRYNTGTADDDRGYAHLVERLMFDGTVHVHDFDAQIDAAGGWTSSATASDHVSVFELVPAEAVSLALWLEAERMAGLADGITDAGLAREVAAIGAERTASYGDHGYARVERAVEHALWPARGDVLGDGIAPTREELRGYIRAHLNPANAVLVIAGRFDEAAALGLVRRDFAWIPGGAIATRRSDVQPPLHAIALTVADPVPKVVVAFRANDDRAELAILAQLLGGRTSPLAHQLVDDGLASDLQAEVRDGEVRIAATVKPAIDPARVAAAIQRAIAELRTHERSPDDVARAVSSVEAELVARLETLAVRIDAIVEWSSHVGFVDTLGRARHALHAVTPASLLRVAKAVLAEQASVTVIGR